MRIVYIVSFLFLLLAISCNEQPESESQNQAPALSFQEARRMLADGKKLVQAADSLHQANEQLLAQEQAAAAMYTLQRLVDQAPDYRSAAIALWGKAAFIKRDYHEAKILLAEAVENDGRDINSLMWLGLSHLATSRSDTAQVLFAQSIRFYDAAEHRSRMVNEIYKVGTTAFEYGVSHAEDGYPKKGFDYKVYGTYVTTMAWELDKDDSMPEAKDQALAYARALLPEAQKRNDEPRVQFLQNVIDQLQ
jgi:tetratricopeptide (TPR) repeat protein